MSAAEPGGAIPYRFRARLMDWYQGWRDGRAGIPDREISVGRVTTPHREALIRLALEVFDLERLRFEQAAGDVPERVVGLTARLDQLRAHEAETERHLAAVSVPLSRQERTWRRVGDVGRAEPVVIQRRQAEHRRRIASARLTLDSIKAEIGRVEAGKAAADQAIERELTAASVRAYRFHEHVHRRLDSYLRTLIRYHFDGEWARAHLTVNPFLPGWITLDAVPDLPPGLQDLPPSDPDDDRIRPEPPTIIALSPTGETVFGAGQPAPYTIEAPGVDPRHFALSPEGPNWLRLRDLGPGDDPYRERVLAKSDRLAAGDHFDVAGQRYTVVAGCTAVSRARVPRVILVISDLCAQARRRSPGQRNPKPLLTDMAFTQEMGTLLAVVGRSGAGKSSLLNVLIGDVAAAAGHALFDELDMLGQSEQVRDRLGFVPQDIDLHGALTVGQLLGYSFQLRYPGPANRGARRIAEVCEQLQLKRLDQLVGTLSGGERRRVSIAIELLSKPDLLILDEPTSGLDPGMDRQIMVQLRKYANAGKTVIVTTHNTAHLRGTAHNVLVVADGGRPIFFGDPKEVRRKLRVDSYAELMDRLTAAGGGPPSAWSIARASQYQRAPLVQAARNSVSGLAGPAAASSRLARRARRPSPVRFGQQLRTLLRRQVTLLRVRGRNSTGLSARTVITALAPFVIAAIGAALAALITPAGGLGPHPGRSGPIAISVLTTLAMLSGQALTYGDLVSEFPIIRREHRTGTGIPAVIVSKWLVFAAMAVIEAALITAVFVVIRPGPAHSNVLPPPVELGADLAVLTVGAMSLGLFISAISTKSEHAVGLVTLASIAQIALNGVTAPLPHPLIWAAALLPDRWGVSAVASSVDLTRISLPPLPGGLLWAHQPSRWLADVVATALLAGGYTLVAAYALWRRLRPRRLTTARPQGR